MNTQLETFNQTDEALVLLLRDDPDLYAVIIDRYTPKLERYIKRISRVSGDEIEDILQEIFVKAYININSFNTELSFNSWIYRIAHNTAINHWKKNRRYTEGVSFDEDTKGFLDHILADDSLMEEKFREADQDIVRDAMKNLKQKHHAILTLRFFEELEYQEIADVLEIPMGTVATNIHRAKKALGKEVSKLENKT